MFKEIREITEIDPVFETKKKEEREQFKNIKPETNITYEEACSFWDNLFASMERS